MFAKISQSQRRPLVLSQVLLRPYPQWMPLPIQLVPRIVHNIDVKLGRGHKYHKPTGNFRDCEIFATLRFKLFKAASSGEKKLKKAVLKRLVLVLFILECLFSGV